MSETSNINLLCLFGGPSSEYEVSLVSAYGVLSNLTDSIDGNVGSAPVTPYPVGVTKDGRWLLYTGPIEHIRDGSFLTREDECTPAALLPGSRLLIGEGADAYTVPIHVAFPMMHGAFGEDGRIQGLLASCGVPFVGPDWASSSVSMDKAMTKQLLREEGIPQAGAILLRKSMLSNEAQRKAIPARVRTTLGFPVFVKPASAGSSVGCSKVKNAEDLLPALEKAFAEGEKVLVEEYIPGKEIEAAVLEENGSLFIPAPGEIDPGAEFYDYDTKYKNDTAAYYIPGRIPPECAEEVRQLAGRVFRMLGCKGLARVDFFVTAEGRVLFNEINTIPGFTPISMYPKLMEAGGIPYPRLILRLLLSAMNRGGGRPA